jgi:hypothetical protein
MGTPYSLDEKRAHFAMARNPGDLRVAAQTCGREGCHPEMPRMLVDDFLRRRCLRCHIHTADPGGRGLYRATGCAACHMLYGNDGRYQGSDQAIDRSKEGYPTKHEFTTLIPNTQCLHCHAQWSYQDYGLSVIREDLLSGNKRYYLTAKGDLYLERILKDQLDRGGKVFPLSKDWITGRSGSATEFGYYAPSATFSVRHLFQHQLA